MTITPDPFPLTWPAKRRTLRPMPSSFDRTRSFAVARAALFDELKRLGASKITLSTNLELRLDGIPRSGQRQPGDTGVAVYFSLFRITQTESKTTPIVLACDRWNRVECNVYAIAKHIEATRAQERWGVGTVDEALAGHALPSSTRPIPTTTTSTRPWREVMSMPDVGLPTADQIERRFKMLARDRHPDTQNGSHEAMAELNAARAAALAEIGAVA